MSVTNDNRTEIFEAMASALRVLGGRLYDVAREVTHEHADAMEGDGHPVARFADDLDRKP